jgi:flagellar biosynthetic protein FliQ
MFIDAIIALTKEAIMVTIIASLPAIAASLVVGLIVALFSATTQIQEQTLSFAPKMIAVYISLLVFAAPLASLIIRFTKSCFTEFIKLSL